MTALSPSSARPRPRDVGVQFGVLPTGSRNAITDVAGVKVGHATLVRGDSVRTGVTAIVPADGNLFHQKVPAGIFVGNGFGKLAGGTQVEELGNLETPILLTNTLGVAAAIEALVEYTLGQPGNEDVRSVNALVGETNDGELNDIRGRHVKPADALGALRDAAGGGVVEGCVGAGTGTVCFGFKGGIGTASRVASVAGHDYVVGVLVQTNFGGDLHIAGVPVGRLLGRTPFGDDARRSGGGQPGGNKSGGDGGGADGSCMIVVATDAPLDPRNLKRLAARAFLGLARTGGIAANGSGDYAIAFSTAPGLRVPHRPAAPLQRAEVLHNDHTSPLFLAAIEAAEEAVVNSLFAATPETGVNGAAVPALPVDEVIALLGRRGALSPA